MKDIYKNPITYYIAVPSIIAIWPLLLWAVSLPGVQKNWQIDKDQYTKARKIMEDILKLDPVRFDLAASKNAAQFDYAAAIDQITRACDISPLNYETSSKAIRSSGGQKSQSALVILKQVDITRFAKFLSAMQLHWANLQCEKVTLTRQKGTPDSWKADLDFKYYY